MIPTIDMNRLVNESLEICDTNHQAPTQKKQRQYKWNDNYELIDFGIPQIVDSPTIKKKFKIPLTCKTDKGQVFNRTVYFGQQDDYVFTKDKSSRLKKLSTMKNVKNPLHSNYWRAQLCFHSDDFKQNWKRMCDYIIDRRLKQMNALPPKVTTNPFKKWQDAKKQH